MLYDALSSHLLRSSGTSSSSANSANSTNSADNMNNTPNTSGTISANSSTSTLVASVQTRRASRGLTRNRSAQSTPSVSPSRTASPAGRMEHIFHLNSSGSSHTNANSSSSSSENAWLTLRIRSNALQSKSHPLYFDKDIIEGTVDLDLSDSPSNIIGVVVIVRGQLYSVNSDQPPFLELSQTLWSSSMGHPRDASLSSMRHDSSPRQSPRHSPLHLPRSLPFSSKLSGAYSWPFSIPLPSQVTVENSGSGQAQVVPLPPSFSAKSVSSFIDYKIQVVVQRGHLRVDNTLTTSFVYLPRARAPRPSHLLESAYQLHQSHSSRHANSNPSPGPTSPTRPSRPIPRAVAGPILGPLIDPEAWDISAPRTISGTLFNNRRTSLDFTLALSRPRTYGRDCPIHVYFMLESADSQLLDLLTPSVFKVQLVQQIQIRIRKQRSEGSAHAYTVHRLYKGDSDTDAEEVVVTGSCWRASSTEGPQQYQYHNQQSPRLHRKHFEGELVVRKDLKPSFQFPRLNVQYFVRVSFQATGFIPLPDQPSISESVTIVTDKPKAPVPHPHPHLPYSPTSSRALPQSRLDP